jgi:hypothetical protein
MGYYMNRLVLHNNNVYMYVPYIQMYILLFKIMFMHMTPLRDSNLWHTDYIRTFYFGLPGEVITMSNQILFLGTYYNFPIEVHS